MTKKTSHTPRILLFANTGTDKDGFIHVGDEAMLLEFYRFYRERFPAFQLSSLVSEPLYPHFELEERRGLGWPATKSEARIYMLKLLFKCAVWKHVKISLFTQEQQEFVEYLDSHDLIHFTGGGNLTSECEQWFYYALFVSACSTLLGKPVILTSQTIGPFSSWIDKTLAVTILNRVKNITLREFSGEQKAHLQREGLRRPEIGNSLDAAYFLPALAGLERQTEFKRSTTVRIGLSIHPYKKNTTKIRELVHAFLERIVQEEGQIEVLLLPHILNRKREYDEQFMESVVAGLPKTVKIIAPNYYGYVKNTADVTAAVKAATATCDLILSSRYHGVIYALSEAVPVLTLVGGEYQCMKNIEALRHVFREEANRFLTLVQRVENKDILLRQAENVRKSLRPISQKIRQRNTALFAENTSLLEELERKISQLLLK